MFPFSRSTLHTILVTRLGYAFKAAGDEREQLKAQAHIFEHRRIFLHRMQKLRVKGYIMWYLDET